MTTTFTYDSPQDHAASLPQFTRYAQNPVFTQSQPGQPSASLYWPWVIRVDSILASPIDVYYMWYSTDHGAGGIYLATAPDPRGPWTPQGLCFQDNVPSSPAECPSVIWNEQTGLFHCYYKSALPPGRSSLATSADGRTSWTFHDQIITAPQPAYPGDGFVGYNRPGRIGNLWFMHHLMGGGNNPHFGISWSHDGITWQTDPRPLVYDQHLTQGILSPDGTPRRIEWNSGQVIHWRGRDIWIGELANFTSGGNPVDRVIAAAPITANLRSLLGPPTVLFTPEPSQYSWESANMRALFILHDDPGDGQGDRLWMYIQCNSNAFGLAVAQVAA